jgi:triosephosphate isomerase
MKRIIVANWKMNPQSAKEAHGIITGLVPALKNLKNTQAVICPSFVHLNLKSKIVNHKFSLGAQDVFWEEEGAYTGGVSSKMLKGLGVTHVIIGHSERRAHFEETNEMVNKKVLKALAAGLKVILCVGEKERTDNEPPQIVKDELLLDLRGVATQKAKNLIIAYEPIWAIGSGHADTPEDLFGMVIYIRRTLLDIFGRNLAEKIPVLYGGSVDDGNTADFLKVRGIHGLLVGRASLDVKKFGNILKIASSLK